MLRRGPVRRIAQLLSDQQPPILIIVHSSLICEFRFSHACELAVALDNLCFRVEAPISSEV
jgi:hypothetical protein